LEVTDKTVMTFGERSVGSPEAIRSWFYPGANSGEEFVYPKRRAVELAKITNVPVFAMPSELESNITRPTTSTNEEPVVALKHAPLVAVKPTGEEVEVSQVLDPPPPPTQTMPAQQTAPVDGTHHTWRLPQTASTLPLVGLIGLLALGAGLALSIITKRVA
jgi:hypothetical protein